MDSRALRKRLITVQDVAREAGVSKATAARVLGGYGPTSQTVREKVLSAAQDLGYQANELARSMSTGRSSTIGVIVGDVENPYFGQAVRGISDVAGAAGFDVILANSGEDLDKERAAVRVFLGKRVDGLIITPARITESQHLQEVQQAGRPLVLLDRYIPSLEVDTVVTNDRAAASAAAQVLIEAGHRRIGYVSATDSDDPVYKGPHQIHLSTVLDRIEGFLDAARNAGISGSEGYIRLGVKRSGTARRIISDLLSLPARPTAILASDNVVALEVFKTVRALGLSIPDDLSLIAFHDADWTSVTSPPITVVAQPSYELGMESAKVLIKRVRGHVGAPRRLVLTTTLIDRQSVSAPALPKLKARKLRIAPVTGNSSD
jgi:LacI family transcriptional regulator